MMKKATLFVFAAFLGLAACSDDSSGTSPNDDIDISSSKEESSSSVKEKSSSSTKTSVKSSSSEEKSSSSKTIKSKDVSSSSAEASSSSSVVAEEKSSSSAEVAGFFTENWREDCLAKINEYRATENLEPLALADEEKQACADEQSANDLAENSAHGHFKACGEFAQNSGPNFSAGWLKTATDVADYYLTMMWEDEKAKAEQGITEYAQIGHYLNMKNTSYTKVACGIALSSDGKKGWFNVDFY